MPAAHGGVSLKHAAGLQHVDSEQKISVQPKPTCEAAVSPHAADTLEEFLKFLVLHGISMRDRDDFLDLAQALGTGCRRESAGILSFTGLEVFFTVEDQHPEPGEWGQTSPNQPVNRTRSNFQDLLLDLSSSTEPTGPTRYRS